MAQRNLKRYNTYTVCSGNNYFRTSNAQRLGLFRSERSKSAISTGSQDRKNYLLKRYKLCNYALNLGKMAVQNKTIGIIGEQYKHFRRPVIPFVVPKPETVNIPYHLEQKVLSGILSNAQRQCYLSSSKSDSYKHVGIQTDYRENEAQTEPWEPPYRIISDHNPEVLTLSHLTWKHGLPAGIHEAHIINRMRMRKAWEAILPPADTLVNIKIRNSIITALEIDEWAFRESEIQSIMDLRLKLMRKVLQKHDWEHKKKIQGRFNRLQDRLGKRRDEQIKAIKNNLKRDLRKLCRRHRDKRHPRKPDIIEQHSDPKSDLYAPRMRFGEHPQRRHEILQNQFLKKSCIDQEADITLNWLPIIEEPRVAERKIKPIDICIRETKWTDEKLKRLHSDLKAIRLNVKSVDGIPTLMKRNYKEPPLPITPCRSGVWDSKQKQLEESTTFIQKIVKGRAIQCLMYEGRDRCRELIEELQSTYALEKQDQEECRDEIHMIELQQIQKDKSIQEDRLCEILNSLEGKTICGTLDFLSKELVRLEDERRAHAFALLAERERYKREAAEAGKRQLERHRRREFDEMFKQIVKVNQDSVETYLEDIITEGIDWFSDKTAKEHILELCDKMDNIYTLENTNIVAEEEMVADMIYNFVLPEVKKHNKRKEIREQQQSYMRNAHISIYEKISDLPNVEASQVDQEEQNIEREVINSTICEINIQDSERIKSESILQNAVLMEESTEIVHDLLNTIIANVIESTGL